MGEGRHREQQSISSRPSPSGGTIRRRPSLDSMSASHTGSAPSTANHDTERDGDDIELTPFIARSPTGSPAGSVRRSASAGPRKTRFQLPDQHDGEKTPGSSDLDSEGDDDVEALDDDAEALIGGRRRRGRARDEVNKNLSSDDPADLIKRAVPETDDPTLPALTIRVFVLGSIFCVAGAAVSQLFFYKSNSPSFSSYFVILTTLPLGRWMARALPARTLSLPFGLSLDLNPGPFNMKEHLLIAVLASSGAHSAYASDIINIQDLFYHNRMGFVSSLTLLLTTQCLGFGFAGLVHSILVKPVAMVFPGCLVTTTMFHTLHGATTRETRPTFRFFMFIFIAIFCYQFLPALITPALSSIALLCLVNNKIPAFRVLSSGYKGLGLFNISLDWTVIGSSGPLYQPWWAAVNYYSGLALAMWIVMPILYFSDFWNAKSFPSVLGAGLYEAKELKKFNVAGVMNADNTLNLEKWEAEKPILLTPWFALSYGIGFATLTSTVTHVLLWHWKDIKRGIFSPQQEDIHNRLMRAYHPVPSSWYIGTVALSLTSAIFMVVLTPSLQLPVWGLFLAVAVALTFLVPVGILKATSDTTVGLNIITEFIAGYLLPGYPVANVLFKCLGYMALSQALDLATDMKVAHYMKIPPRSMFVAQVMGTVIGCLVNLGVVRLVLDPANGYRGFIDGSKVDPTGQWDGRKVNIFYSASVIWGAIGPAEFFSGKYRKLYLGFIIGIVVPFIPWLVNRRYPRKWLGQINAPVFLHAAGLPPQLPNNIITSGFITAFASQYWARKKHPKWHASRNYVLSAALDAGSSVNALFVFVLTITVLKSFPIPHWTLNPTDDSEMCQPSS